MVKGLPVEWGTCSRTVSLGHLVYILSYHNNSVAVGSRSHDIIILDAITGSQIATLSGHTDWVRCLTFFPDGKSLVSGGGDKTIKLWDVQTGGVVKTFCGHTGYVLSVSVSVDCARVASGSRDNTVHLWDIDRGECLYTIEQQDAVQHVSFYPMDPQHLISISDDKVNWWDVNNDHQIPSTYDGSHISFSSDHTQFALCNGKVVTIQHSGSKAIMAEFHVANGSTRHCCFSPDGRLVAVAADNTAYVWDITSPDPHLVEMFIGHTEEINSLVFSSPSSLISASNDKSVKFWQIGVLFTDKAITDPGSIPVISPIQSVSLQTSAGIAISSDNDGVVKTWDLSTGLCKETFQIPAASGIGLSEGDAQMVNGRLIFVWYGNKKIHIWDINKDKLLQTLDLDTSLCMCLRISGDGSKVIFLDEGSIQAWSMWTWKPVGKVKLGLKGILYLDPLSTSGTRVWIHSYNSSAQEGWDFGTSLVPFDPSTGRPHLDFIGGARWQTSDPSWIKDKTTGKKVFQLSGRYAKPNDVRWDGQYLVAGYENGEVLILDFDHMYLQ